MKKLIIFLFLLMFQFSIHPQEDKEKNTFIKSYELKRGRRIAPSMRNPFLKREEFLTPEIKHEEIKKEEVGVPYVPKCEYNGFITSRNKKIAIIKIDGVEAIAGEGEEIMNFRILKIKEDEIEVFCILTNENLKIPFTGGEE